MNDFFFATYTSVQVWILGHSLAILSIVVLIIGMRIFNAVVLDKLIRKLIPAAHFHSVRAEKQREDTLIRIARGTLNTIVWILAILMALSEVGVDIGPLLAAAGVAGLAIGFGGQYLIRDIVAGLFIILENQYRVGDIVSLDEVTGVVEDVSIRMTTGARQWTGRYTTYLTGPYREVQTCLKILHALISILEFPIVLI